MILSFPIHSFSCVLNTAVLNRNYLDAMKDDCKSNTADDCFQKRDLSMLPNHYLRSNFSLHAILRSVVLPLPCKDFRGMQFLTPLCDFQK